MICFALMLFMTAVAFEEPDADAEWVEIPAFLTEPFLSISSFAVFISQDKCD